MGITFCANGLLRHPECMDVFHWPLTYYFLSRGYISYRCSYMTVRAKQADTQNHRHLSKPFLNTVMSTQMCSPPFSSKWSCAQHFIHCWSCVCSGMAGPVLASAPLLVDLSHISPEKQFTRPIISINPQ